MVTGYGVAPQSMLEPEGGVEQRIVLLRCADLKPDTGEAGERLQFGRRDVRIVVPKDSAAQRRKIDQEEQEEQQGGQSNIAPFNIEVCRLALRWSGRRRSPGSCLLLHKNQDNSRTKCAILFFHACRAPPSPCG